MKAINEVGASSQKRVQPNNKFISTLKRDTASWLLILPFVFLFVAFFVEPAIRGILWSFREMNGYTPGEFAGLANYRAVLQDTQFTTTLLNTVKYVLWSLVIGFWPPVILAIMLNEMKWGKKYFKFAFYFPCMVPGIASSLLWYYIYFPNESGLLNTALAFFGQDPSGWLQNPDLTIPLILISNTWKAMGSSMLIYLAALQGVNRDLYEAAMMDGAGFWRRLWKISLPQISGIVLINFIRQIIGVFQIMEQPLAMTDGGPNGASMSLGLQGYRYAFQYFRIGESLSLNVVMFLMLSVLTVIYFMVKKRMEQ